MIHMFLRILTLSFLALIVFFTITETENVNASSPSFPRQEIQDDVSDWIDMETLQSTEEGGETLSDILLVNYFSDGNYLNATLWLTFPVNEGPSIVDELTYGMLIDVDANENTGIKGVDYVVEIKWEDNVWTRYFTELSTHQEVKLLSKNVENFETFFDKGKKYVTLSVDLKTMGFPEIYKVSFFTQEVTDAESQKIGLADFTKWVHIPAPNFIIFTQPSPAIIRAGDDQTIEVLIQSTSEFEPEIILDTVHLENFELEFIPDRFNMTSHGLSSTGLKIKVDENTKDRPYTLLVLAKATFPTESAESQILRQTNYSIPDIVGQTIMQQSPLSISVLPAIPLHEKIIDFLGKTEAVISLVVGIGTAINIYIISIFRKKKLSQNSE